MIQRVFLLQRAGKADTCRNGTRNGFFVWNVRTLLATFTDTIGMHDERNVIWEINNEEKMNGDCTVAVEEAVSSLPQLLACKQRVVTEWWIRKELEVVVA